jgi:hypothetical protein
MLQMRAVLFVLAFGFAAIAQDTPAAQSQVTQVPPKPTCNPNALFHTTACEDLWEAYDAALAQRQKEELQLYINKQKENATSQATAPLIQKISEQQDQIKRLQAELPIERAVAHKDGMVEGGVYSGGGVLLLFAVIFGIRKLSQGFTVSKKTQTRSASA